MTLAERLTRRIVVNENGCWVWQAYKNQGGYGCLAVNGRKESAHRASHMAFKGPIPPGLDIDHLCRNRACINPDHLEAVTRQVNVLRGMNACANHARKTHCKRGHELTPTVEQGRSRRRCLTCQSASVARYQQRKRAEALASAPAG